MSSIGRYGEEQYLSVDAAKAKQDMSDPGPQCLTSSDVFGYIEIGPENDFFRNAHVIIRKKYALIAIDRPLVFLDNGRIVTYLFPNVLHGFDEALQLLRHTFARVDPLLTRNKGRL